MEDKPEDREEEATVAVPGSLSELKSLFPIPVTTFKGSLTLAKQFTVLTLSLVTYSRGIFPAYAFSEKTYKGFSIKVLSGRRVCCDAYLFTKWLKSSFSALEKGYMRELIFEVMNIENKTLEYYSVAYQYKGDSIQCSVNASDKKIADFDEASFQRSFANLISSALKFLKRLEPLPEAFKLQLRILYYDERTPENFIPDYFRDSDLNAYENAGRLAECLGSIGTPFHGITLKIAGRYKLDIDDEKENKDEKLSSPNPEKKRKMSIENQIECIEENETKSTVAGPQQKKITWGDLRKTAILNTIQSKKPADTKSPVSRVEKTNASQTSKINVNCICSMNALKTGIFQCVKCTDWHHLVCYRRKPTTIVNSSSKVACVKCAADNHGSECLDSSLVSKKVPMEMIEKIAVFRQMVFKLRWFAVVSTSTLVEDCKVSLDQAKLVIDKLMKKKLLTPSTRSGDYNVNTSLLIAFINGYFR